MQGARIVKPKLLDESASASEGVSRITVSHGWMPKSGYGPYCTIPVPVLDSLALRRCGFSSFADARCDIDLLADVYRERAAALVARAKEQRLTLSQQIRGLSGELLIRPHRLRLSLSMRDNYLYLGWRGVVKIRGKPVRYEAPTWNCESRLDLLIADVHPAEEQLIRQIEVAAAEIRRRWFALVRTAHYMNVVTDHFHGDAIAANAPLGARPRLLSAVFRRVRRLVA